MKLLTKFTLIVAIPCVMQASFLFYFGDSLSRIQMRVSEIGISSALVSKINFYFLELTRRLVTSSADGQVYEHIAPLEKEGLRRSFDDNSRAVRLEQVNAAARALSTFSSLPAPQPVRAKASRTNRNRSPGPFFLVKFDDFYCAVRSFVDNEEQKISTYSRQTNQMLDRLIFNTIDFLLVCSAVTAALGFYYVRIILEPVNLLRARGAMLAARQPLPAPSADSNQFGELERLFYALSLEIEAALDRERVLLNQTEALIFVLDADTTLITAINDFGERLLGYPSDKLLGHSIFAFVRSHDCSKLDQSLNAVLTSKNFQALEVELSTISGESLRISLSMRMDVITQSIFCVALDLSEFRELDEVRTRWLKLVSDDLQNSLTLISESLRLAVKNILANESKNSQGSPEQTANPRQDELVKELNRLSNRVHAIKELVLDFLTIQNLNTFSKLVNLNEFSISDILNDALDFVQTDADNRHVRIEVEPFAAIVICDCLKVRQLLVNLLSNAVKFSKPGGVVRVFFREQKDTALLCIEDSGDGIPIELRTKIFEAFEQLPGPQDAKGTGLGLTICKMITDAHGWSLSVETSDRFAPAEAGPVCGSVFCIGIPNRHRYTRFL